MKSGVAYSELRFNRYHNDERWTDEQAAARVRAAIDRGWRPSVSKGRHISTMFMRSPAPGALFVRARKHEPRDHQTGSGGSSSCGVGFVLHLDGERAFEDKVAHGWLAYHPTWSKAPNGGLYRTRKAAAESLLANVPDYWIGIGEQS